MPWVSNGEGFEGLDVLNTLYSLCKQVYLPRIKQEKICNKYTISWLVGVTNSKLTIFVPWNFWVPRHTFSDLKLRSSLSLSHINRAFSSPLPFPCFLLKSHHNLGWLLHTYRFSESFLSLPGSIIEVRLFFSKLSSCAHLHMPASPEPHNTLEVTVPPHFGQDQSFSFTFHAACPGPVVSFIFLVLKALLNMYTSDSKNHHGPTTDHPREPIMHPCLYMRPVLSNWMAFDSPLCLGWCLANSSPTSSSLPCFLVP